MNRRLLIGNKNYSSWSLRPWLFMKMNALRFEEERVALYQPESAPLMAASPSGKVPLLVEEDLRVWDSLAICLHLIASEDLAVGLPQHRAQRAEALSLVSEMHSGFTGLRTQLPMNCRRKPAPVSYDDAAARDIARIDVVWRSCRERFGGEGPGLFGPWSLADVFFAPVAIRFDRYQVALHPTSAAYGKSLLALPAMLEWVGAAVQENEQLPQFER